MTDEKPLVFEQHCFNRQFIENTESDRALRRILRFVRYLPVEEVPFEALDLDDGV